MKGRCPLEDQPSSDDNEMRYFAALGSLQGQKTLEDYFLLVREKDSAHDKIHDVSLLSSLKVIPLTLFGSKLRQPIVQYLRRAISIDAY